MSVVVGAATLWVLFGSWLFLGHVDAPRALTRTVAVLTWLELIALLGWGRALPTHAASEEIPLFAVVVLGAGALYGRGIGRRTSG
jgi:hypothetical protein